MKKVSIILAVAAGLALSAGAQTATKKLQLDIGRPERTFQLTISRGSTEYIEANLFVHGVAYTNNDLDGYIFYTSNQTASAGTFIYSTNTAAGKVHFQVGTGDSLAFSTTSSEYPTTNFCQIVLTNATQSHDWDHGKWISRWSPAHGSAANANITQNIPANVLTNLYGGTYIGVTGTGRERTISVTGSVVVAESDPIWTAASNTYLRADTAGTTYQPTGTYVTAESDPLALLATGTRAMSANLDMGGNSITNIGAASLTFSGGVSIAAADVTNWKDLTNNAVTTESDPVWAAASNTAVYLDAQYPNAVLRDGSRAMTLPLNFGTYWPTNMSRIWSSDALALRLDTGQFLLVDYNLNLGGKIATNGTYYGSGVGLTSLNGANITASTIGSNALDSATDAAYRAGGSETDPVWAAASNTAVFLDAQYPNAVLIDGTRQWTGPHNAGWNDLNNAKLTDSTLVNVDGSGVTNVPPAAITQFSNLSDGTMDSGDYLVIDDLAVTANRRITIANFQAGLTITTNNMDATADGAYRGGGGGSGFPLTEDADFDGYGASNVISLVWSTNSAAVAMQNSKLVQYVQGGRMYYVLNSVTNYLSF